VARLFCEVTDDVAAVRRMVKAVFAPYVATSGYNRFYRWMGYEDEAEAIAVAAAARDRDAMAGAFSDRVVDDLFLIGTADEVCEQIAAHVDAGVTVPVIAPLTSTHDGAAATFEAIGRTWSG
jgi:alkanesulfonate monooxygenase SsuD/methylene tetrahydromethanopterin reductase-like flavin-dependent oxidoreductase (luciferase family)